MRNSAHCCGSIHNCAKNLPFVSSFFTSLNSWLCVMLGETMQFSEGRVVVVVCMFIQNSFYEDINLFIQYKDVLWSIEFYYLWQLNASSVQNTQYTILSGLCPIFCKSSPSLCPTSRAINTWRPPGNVVYIQVVYFPRSYWYITRVVRILLSDSFANFAKLRKTKNIEKE